MCLGIAFPTFLLQSCCKGYCSDEAIFAIDLVGFTPPEIEKIKIVTYNRDNNIAAVDSYYVSSNNIIRKDTSRVYLDKPLRSDFNFEVIVESPLLSYEVSDIETKKEDCNCGSGTYKTITAYTLNGVQYNYSNINPVIIKK